MVVDRQGVRVSGLSPGDFELTVDGRSVPIEYFSEVHLGKALERPAGEAGDSVPQAPAAVEPGKAVGTSYLVFIDSYFTRLAAERNRVLDQIEAGLYRLGREDRMAIVAFDGRKIEMLSSWSQSTAQLERALDRARGLPASGFINDSLVRGLDRGAAQESVTQVDNDAQAAAGETGQSAESDFDVGRTTRQDGQPADICAAINRLEHRLERASLGVAATLRSFAKPPGRKVMMMLSGGWPQSAKDYLVGTMTPFAAGDCPDRGARLWEPIHSTANLLGYTLYPVDIPTPKATAIHAAAKGDELFGGGNVAAPVGGEVQFVRQFEREATLLKLAAETGGEAIVGRGNTSAFDRIVDDTRSYYWLGFTPKWRGDDKNHDIKLRATVPGLEVRSRNGFQDLSRSKEVSFVTESALLFGDLPGSIPLGLALGSPRPKGRGKIEVPVQLNIPMDEVAMLPDGDHFVAELELRIAAIDEEGNRNELPVVPVILQGPEPPPGVHSVYETSIKIRNRPHNIVISLYDPLGDRILAASGSVRP